MELERVGLERGLRGDRDRLLAALLLLLAALAHLTTRRWRRVGLWGWKQTPRLEGVPGTLLDTLSSINNNFDPI